MKHLNNKSSPITIIVVAAIWILTTGFSFFGYEQPIVYSRLISYNNWGKPVSHTFVALVYHKKLQRPSGIINTFPNGGASKVLRQWVSVYICDADMREAKEIAEIVVPDDLSEETRFSISPLWLRDTFFISINGYKPSWKSYFWGRPPDLKPKKRIYAIRIDGPVKKVESIPKDAKEHVPSEVRRSPDFQIDNYGKYVWLAINWTRVAVETDESPKEGHRRLSEIMFVLDKDSGQLKVPEQRQYLR